MSTQTISCGSTSTDHRTLRADGRASSSAIHPGRNRCSAARGSSRRPGAARGSGRRGAPSARAPGPAPKSPRCGRALRAGPGVAQERLRRLALLRFGPHQREARERGQASAATLFERLGAELPVALQHQHPQQGVLRVVGLEQDPAGALTAAGPARDLEQQLRHPLRGPEVDAEQSGVGVEDRDQGDVREVVPLREHLGADHRVDLARVHAVEQRLQRPAPADRVAVHPGHAQALDSSLQRARDPLGAEPQAAHVLRAAPGALVDERALRAAVVAAQPVVLSVQHQVCVAPVAVRDPAAGEAHEPGRVAAPVDEQERLLGTGLRLLQRLDEHVGEAVVEGALAQVDDVDAGRGGAAGTVRQLEPAVAVSAHVVDGLQRRSGAPEHDRSPGVPGAHHREVARGVPEPVLLLEREVVLLVDDEQSRAARAARTPRSECPPTRPRCRCAHASTTRAARRRRVRSEAPRRGSRAARESERGAAG